MEVSGNTFTFYQGETPDLGFPVDDGTNPYDLTGGAAVLTYKATGATVVSLPCTIDTTNVTAEFTHAVTRVMLGNYTFQLMCRNAAGKIVMTKTGVINVKESQDPDAVAI